MDAGQSLSDKVKVAKAQRSGVVQYDYLKPSYEAAMKASKGEVVVRPCSAFCAAALSPRHRSAVRACGGRRRS